MKGLQIFMHSLRMVLGNLGDALRISAVLYVVPAFFNVLSARAPATLDAPADAGIELSGLPAGFGLMVFAIVAFWIIAALWIAVAWHRFVLEEDYPRGWIPPWPGTRLFAYLWRMILIGLTIAFAMLFALLPLGTAMAVSAELAMILLSGMAGLASYLFFRLGAALPAAAIGEQMSLRESWNATRDRDGGLALLALLVFAATAAIGLVNQLAGGIGPTLELVLTVILGWLSTMVGVSLLTTIYGHYVQGRPID